MSSPGFDPGSANLSEANGAASGISQLLARWGLFVLAAQVTCSSLAIIWLGAYSSLRRPPSAAPAKRKGKKGKKTARDEEDKFGEGLDASDAIMFPLLAGALLIGLYYLIQWLQDADLLNRILRAYLSCLSVVSLSKLAADTLHFLTSLVFPSVWSDWSGRLYKIDQARRQQLRLGAAPEPAHDKKTPFPGVLSAVALPDRASSLVWGLRGLLTEQWTVRVALHGLGAASTEVKLNDVLGILLAVAISSVYYLTSWFWLSNILGSAFCYTAFSLLSPTSFAIGTMVLTGLFFYDIVMVFYSPYMITVATKLDVPIKLVFQTAARPSMIGLGDIVVPGIFIALALRFDLWMHYNRKITQVATELTSEYAGDKTTTTATTTQHRSVKAPYIDPRGRWGDRLWTARNPLRLLAAPTATPALAATAFSKTYFYASMAGYAAGMLLTEAMLLVFHHGQPALLYLVPCVTGAAWLTGFVRGETRDMWTYTEDGSLDTEDVVVEVDGDGNVIEEGPSRPSPSDGKSTGEKEKEPASSQADAEGRPVFLFSITAPLPGQTDEDEDEGGDEDERREQPGAIKAEG